MRHAFYTQRALLAGVGSHIWIIVYL